MQLSSQILLILPRVAWMPCCRWWSALRITLYAGRFGQVGIEVEAVEGCNCSQDVDVSSRECSYKGDLVCGSCLCQELRYGERCECYGEERMCPESNGVQCTGHGQCSPCGTCACIEGFAGSDCKIIIPTSSEAATPSVSFTSTVETSSGTSQTVTPAPTNDLIPGLGITQPAQPTRSPRQLLADGISIAVTLVEISIYSLILYFTGGIALGYIVSYCAKKYAWIVRRRKPNARNMNVSQLNVNEVPMMSNVAYSDFVSSRQPNAMTEVELSLCQGLPTTDSNYKASAGMDTSAYQLESHSVNVYENVNTPGTYSDSFSIYY